MRMGRCANGALPKMQFPLRKSYWWIAFSIGHATVPVGISLPAIGVTNVRHIFCRSDARSAAPSQVVPKLAKIKIEF